MCKCVCHNMVEQKQRHKTRSPVKASSDLENDDSDSNKSGDNDDATSTTKTESNEEKLDSMGESLILVIIPVTISLFLIVLIIKTICNENDSCRRGFVTPFPTSDDSNQDFGEKVATAALNVMVLVAIIVFATFVLLLVFYLRCYRLIAIYCLISLSFILTLFTLNFLFAVLTAFELPFDWPTMGLFIWNFAVTGILCFTVLVCPVLLKQGYLIFISSMVSFWIILKLPAISTWLLLFVLIFWDLCAVLTPYGPLRLIIELIDNRRKKNNENIKLPEMMAYSTMIHLISSGTGGMTMLMAHHHHHRRGHPKRSKSKRVFKPTLGLGDFVFYNILVGQTAISNAMVTTFYSMIAILFGLISTLILLAVYRRALPALPISLMLALPFVLVMSLCGEQYSIALNKQLVFI